ncbi:MULTISPECIES: DUF7525 family protein [Haladaptatus]|uniref:Uncharacterized protein n=2 Tax=Haladaptatus paucihalophilus DX253 TaxID=797209 RepID=A0A1M6SE41_HALPU|nr:MULTISPECIES: hypothetical protein [Haladaptatus]GKZ12447.1 hypothetical protein HAL_03280 [Haladaptatus sp. T7]SHK42991.1 hypothetical protein SAMN05444342_1237 [Haladaptatus paucihalophilus DX253]
MAGTQAVTTDMGTGLSVLFVLLAIAGAAVTFVTPGTETAAWGFAAAMIAGVLAVAASHLYQN